MSLIPSSSKLFVGNHLRFPEQQSPRSPSHTAKEKWIGDDMNCFQNDILCKIPDFFQFYPKKTCLPRQFVSLFTNFYSNTKSLLLFCEKSSVNQQNSQKGYFFALIFDKLCHFWQIPSLLYDWCFHQSETDLRDDRGNRELASELRFQAPTIRTPTIEK